MEKGFVIDGERLLLALDWLEFVASIEEFFDEPRGFDGEAAGRVARTEHNPREFRTDALDIDIVFESGFGIDEKEMGAEAGDWKPYYETTVWQPFHEHLKRNAGAYARVRHDVEALLNASTDMSDPIGRSLDGVAYAGGFRRFLRKIASGELTERDLIKYGGRSVRS